MLAINFLPYTLTGLRFADFAAEVAILSVLRLMKSHLL